MTVELKLDTNALNALFPEGSEARVNLQRAVVVNLLQKLAIKDTKLLDGQLLRQAADAVKDTLKEKGILEYSFGPDTVVALNPKIVTAIKDEAKRQVGTTISSAIELAYVERKKELEEFVDARMKAMIDRKFGIGLDAAFKRYVADAMTDIFKVAAKGGA